MNEEKKLPEIIIRMLPNGKGEVIMPFQNEKLCKEMLKTAAMALYDYHRVKIVPPRGSMLNFARKRF